MAFHPAVVSPAFVWVPHQKKNFNPSFRIVTLAQKCANIEQTPIIDLRSQESEVHPPKCRLGVLPETSFEMRGP